MDLEERAREKYGLKDPLKDQDFSGDDFVQEFLEEQELRGRRPRTLKNYRIALRDFENYLKKLDGTHIGKANRRQILKWKKRLDDRGLAKSTIGLYLNCLSSFYSYLKESQLYPHSTNPAKPVVEDHDEGANKSKRRKISVEEMSKYVKKVRQPRDRAIIVTLLKTGMRRGELANLKLEHIGIEEINDQDPVVRENSIFIDSSLEGNKRKVDTHIPLDEETRATIKTYLAVRPNTDHQSFLINLNTNEPLVGRGILRIVKKHSKKVGWHNKGDGVKKNVTPHYFRHFFTTKLRERGMPDVYVDYLRGDTPKTAKDTYTHLNWEEIKEKYENYIYKLGI